MKNLIIENVKNEDCEKSSACSADTTTISSISTEKEKGKFLSTKIKNFMAKESLEEMYLYKFNDESQQMFNIKFMNWFTYFNQNDAEWFTILECLFQGIYPIHRYEVIVNGAFAHTKYCQREIKILQTPITYKTTHYTPIKIKDCQINVIAPNTLEVDVEKKTVTQTVNTTRAKQLEKRSTALTNLYEVITYDRPAYGVNSGWAFEDSKLPTKISPSILVSKEINYPFLQKFTDDLFASFSWSDPKHAINYLTYLLQPMLAHLMPGQMPGYAFLGPTKSGKGFLSEVLVKALYSNGIKPTVALKKLLSNQYELDVFLSEINDAIYIVFDEIKNSSDEDLKIIDSLLTNEKIQSRKMRHGYVQTSNRYVVALTSVYKNFSDETEGRLIKIELNGSDTLKVQNFYEKWKNQMPIILATIFERLNNVIYTDTTNLPKIEDRRMGFRLMSYFVEQVFGLTPDYSISTSTNDMLDTLCDAAEFYKTKTKNGQLRLTPKNISDFMAQNRRYINGKDKLINEIYTALAYTTTRNNPAYKNTGYLAENGKYYHLRIAKERNGESYRHYVYIDPQTSTQKSLDRASVEPEAHLAQMEENLDEIFFNELTIKASNDYDDIYFAEIADLASNDLANVSFNSL